MLLLMFLFKVIGIFQSLFFEMTFMPLTILSFTLKIFFDIDIDFTKFINHIVKTIFTMIVEFFSVKNLILRLLYLLKKTIKFFLILLFIFTVSIIFCVIINSLLRPPQQIVNVVEFSFDEKKSLKGEINVNCFNSNYNKNCIFLENTIYSLNLELELMRNQAYQNDKYKNFEIEMNLNGVRKNEILKKIAFIEKYDYMIEFIYDVIYFPFRLIGFCNYHKMIINFIENFDNLKVNLEAIDILINDQFINVKQAKLILKPHIGWITFFLGMTRYFILPIAFFFAMIGQLIFYFGIKFVLTIISHMQNTVFNETEEKQNNSNITNRNNLLPNIANNTINEFNSNTASTSDVNNLNENLNIQNNINENNVQNPQDINSSLITGSIVSNSTRI